MFFIYSITLTVLIILSVIFFKYKKNIRDGITINKNPLVLFYGLSFFIIDSVKNINVKLKKSNSAHIFSSAKKKALMLNPGNNSIKFTYLIIAKKLSACIAAAIIFMLLGALYTFNIPGRDSDYINELQRPTDGSYNTTYSLQVNTEDSTEYIDLNVSKKMYEYSEVIALFDTYRDELIQTMLNKNKSSDCINSPLCFISSIGAEDIKLSWQPEDTAYIDFNGNLLYENISPEGTDTTIYVSMELNDITASLAIGVTLYPAENNTAASLKSQIQSYINTNSSPYSDWVQLPSQISGNNVLFSYPKKNTDWLFLVMALISSPLLYILVSRETEKKLKNRRYQLMQDYPEIVSKLLLLCNAGLNIHNAFKKIVEDYKNSGSKPRYAYEELSITINSLKSGKPESSAYTDFGRRCGLMPYIKLGALLEQNLQKGAKELRYHLSNEVRNAFEKHKSDTITMSKQAETKLIFPMIMILMVIMALIMIPSFMNI